MSSLSLRSECRFVAQDCLKYYLYVLFDGKQLFAIKVAGSTQPITIDGRGYRYLNQKIVETNPEVFTLKGGAYSRIVQLSQLTGGYKQSVTHPGATLFGHYLGVLKIMDNLQDALFPAGADQVTTILEGKILSKILFSSVVDNFEVYLGDLLYAISLGRPETLKSTQTVTIICNTWSALSINWIKLPVRNIWSNGFQ